LANLLDINPTTGDVALKNDQRLPAYLPGGNNDYAITLTATDTREIGTLTITLTITDVFNLTVAATPSGLQFQWEKIIDDADLLAGHYYQLQQDINGDGAFVTLTKQVAGNTLPLNITNTQYTHDSPLHLINRNSQYQLKAIQASGTLIRTSVPLRLGDALQFPEDIVTMISYQKASNIGEYDYFGGSVAISADGQTLAVGANLEDSGVAGDDCGTTFPLPKTTNCQSDSGAVYVFEKTSTTGWRQQSRLKASNAGAYDWFGGSVALSFSGHQV